MTLNTIVNNENQDYVMKKREIELFSGHFGGLRVNKEFQNY